ncbi:MAG: GNAT family N-acetyltransferase [Clostridia bacterium]|nr:GNAT family N-acetyltransferase [Clostridia bacterium]
MRDNWTPENKTLGQCSVTAFLLQDLYGGRVYGVPLEDGSFHCFNAVDGCVFDLTSEQFGDTALDYGNCPEQFRETHFAKEEKRLRYEDLKVRFLKCLPKIIETDRLILRPFAEGDAADVLAYLQNPTVNCFMDMRLPTLAAAKRAVKQRMRDREYYFAVVEKESGKVIGEFFGEPEGTAPGREPADTFSPCWMLHPAWQGKGYAYEAAKAYFDYLFNEKGIRRVYAYTEDTNIPSQRLCEKLGMRREGLFREFVSFVNDPDGTLRYENTYQYAILKKEWR